MHARSMGLVDDRIVEDSRFLKRDLGPVVLKRPDPVVSPGQAYGSVLRDPDGQWRMWYTQFFTRDPKKHVVGCDTPICLALSRDGMNWEKPRLGLVREGGSTANNIVLGSRQQDPAGRYLTGYGVCSALCILDARTDPHPHARGRFTAMTVTFPTDSIGGICLYHSDDGLHWTAYPENPVIIGSQDTQNCLVYDARIRRYVCYQRPTIHCGMDCHANRKMARVESEDLVHWGLSRVMLDTDELDAPGLEWFDEPGMPKPRGRNKQFQGMTPWIEHGCYLALAWLYDAVAGTFQLELIHSGDGIDWKREPLRRPLIADNVPAGFAGKLPLPMGSPPVPVGDEQWLYCSNSPFDHHSIALSEFAEDRDKARILLETEGIYLLAIKRDRWIGYEAGEREGELLTTPLNWDGGQPLYLNANVAEGGRITVAFEDQWARPIRECHLDEIQPIDGPVDTTGRRVEFGPGPKTIVKFPVPGPVRMRFRLRKATLYGWSFG